MVQAMEDRVARIARHASQHRSHRNAALLTWASPLRRMAMYLEPYYNDWNQKIKNNIVANVPAPPDMCLYVFVCVCFSTSRHLHCRMWYAVYSSVQPTVAIRAKATSAAVHGLHLCMHTHTHTCVARLHCYRCCVAAFRPPPMLLSATAPRLRMYQFSLRCRDILVITPAPQLV